MMSINILDLVFIVSFVGIVVFLIDSVVGKSNLFTKVIPWVCVFLVVISMTVYYLKPH